MNTYDSVSQPFHYTADRSIQPLAVIEDWKLNYHLGNVLKYISRVDRKENTLEDLQKAATYLAREIERRSCSNET